MRFTKLLISTLQGYIKRTSIQQPHQQHIHKSQNFQTHGFNVLLFSGNTPKYTRSQWSSKLTARLEAARFNSVPVSSASNFFTCFCTVKLTSGLQPIAYYSRCTKCHHNFHRVFPRSDVQRTRMHLPFHQHIHTRQDFQTHGFNVLISCAETALFRGSLENSNRTYYLWATNFPYLILF